MPIELTLSTGFPRYARSLLETAARILPAADAEASEPSLRAGAVIQDGSGREFAAGRTSQLSVECAESAAVAAAQREDCLDLRILAVVTASAAGAGIELPCGSCRQLLWEAVRASGRDIEIYCADTSLSTVLLVTAGELLPFAVGNQTLISRPDRPSGTG